MATEASRSGVKCGLKFDPVTLVLFYKSAKEPDKLRKRSMPLRHLGSRNSMSGYADELQNHERNGQFVKLIPTEQLILLLERAKKGKDFVKQSSSRSSQLTKSDVLSGTVSKVPNKLPPVTKNSDPFGLSSLPSLQKSSLVSQGNSLGKESHQSSKILNKGVHHDQRNTPNPPSTLSKGYAWPESEQQVSNTVKPVTIDKSLDLEDLLEDISEAVSEAEESSQQQEEENAPVYNTKTDGIFFGNIRESLETKKKEDKEEDLNHVAEGVLAQRKEEMTVLFEENKVKPGDQDWVYDKEVDFDEADKVSCGEWDNSSGSSDPDF